MSLLELAAKPKETVLSHVRIERVGQQQEALLPQLARIYYQTWSAEGLCASPTEALTKMTAFNPEDTFVVIDDKDKVYAMIQTLPVTLPSVSYLPHVFPTYASVESASSARQRAVKPNFLICFSINALPNFRVATPNGKNQSLARHLLTNLPTSPDCHKVAFTRYCDYDGPTALDFYLNNLSNPKKLGSVGMHETLGGLTAAIINNSRPEDVGGGGANILVVYPNNQNEKNIIEIVRINRLLHKPITHSWSNSVVFTDLPF